MININRIEQIIIHFGLGLEHTLLWCESGNVTSDSMKKKLAHCFLVILFIQIFCSALSMMSFYINLQLFKSFVSSLTTDCIKINAIIIKCKWLSVNHTLEALLSFHRSTEHTRKKIITIFVIYFRDFTSYRCAVYARSINTYNEME